MAENKHTTGEGRQLLKEQVTGWLVIRDKDMSLVTQRALVAETDDVGGGELMLGSIELRERDEIVAVLPSHAETLRVTTFFECGKGRHEWEEVVLGFEYPHASTPNWDDVIDEHPQPHIDDEVTSGE